MTRTGRCFCCGTEIERPLLSNGRYAVGMPDEFCPNECARFYHTCPTHPLGVPCVYCGQLGHEALSHDECPFPDAHKPACRAKHKVPE